MKSAQALELNSLRNIVEDYQQERPGSPAISVIPSHIGANGATYGYVESDDAQAISTIIGIATTPTRIRPAKLYTFKARFGGWEPTVTITGPGIITGRIYLTEASYRRFVALANSGEYAVGIEAEEHVGWTLRRKAA